MKANEVMKWLEPNKIEIVNCHPFTIDEVPPKVEGTILENGLKRPTKTMSIDKTSSQIIPSNEQIPILNKAVSNEIYDSSQPQTLESGLPPAKLESAPPLNSQDRFTYVSPSSQGHTSYVPPTSTIIQSNVQPQSQIQPNVQRQTYISQPQPQIISSQKSQPFAYEPQNRPKISERMNLRDVYTSPDIINKNDRRYETMHSAEKRPPQVRYTVHNPISTEYRPITNYQPIASESRNPYQSEIKRQ